MSNSTHHAAVIERLAALATDHETAREVHEYVTSDAPTPTADALLTTIRLDPALALEVRDDEGHDVIAALTDSQGVVRYPTFVYSAAAENTDMGVARTRRLERYRGAHESVRSRAAHENAPRSRDAADYLDDHQPRVVLREATELAELEAPTRWQAIDGPGQFWEGP